MTPGSTGQLRRTCWQAYSTTPWHTGTEADERDRNHEVRRGFGAFSRLVTFFFFSDFASFGSLYFTTLNVPTSTTRDTRPPTSIKAAVKLSADF